MTVTDTPLPHYKHVDWSSPELAYRMYIAYLSLFFDVAVLAYHFYTPFHPKFYVKPTRRRVLRLHIFSGFISCVFAFYAEDPTKYAYVAAFFAILSHVPSTFYQIPTVLGIKAFLVPSLFMVTALHGYFAYNLVQNPTSFYYLLSSYLTVHIYAWSRVFFALYYRLKLFEGHRFSAAMLTSGMLLVPSVMGLTGNVCLLVGVLTFDVIARSVKSNEFWISWTTEHPRELAANPDKRLVLETLITAAEVSNAVHELEGKSAKERYAHICSKVRSANTHAATPRDKAVTVFRAIDTDRNNELSVEECRVFLRDCGVAPHDSENKLLLESLFENRKVATMDEFCAWFTKNWIHSNTKSIPHLPKTPRGQAKFRHDNDGDGTIGFQEFYRNMPTIWKFAIQSFIDEGKILVEN
ncbi:hypothetical protein BGZ76_002143 [Entomortierella beljakovae]|nr:hypothetical protein BGZ76_002143 [Entomortierella beljakovae]